MMISQAIKTAIRWAVISEGLKQSDCVIYLNDTDAYEAQGILEWLPVSEYKSPFNILTDEIGMLYQCPIFRSPSELSYLACGEINHTL